MLLPIESRPAKSPIANSQILSPIYDSQRDGPINEGMRAKDTQVTLDMARDAVLARYGEKAGGEVLEKQVLQLYKPEGFPDYLRGVVLVGELPVQVTADRIEGDQQQGITGVVLNINYHPGYLHRVSIDLTKPPSFYSVNNEPLNAIQLGQGFSPNISEHPANIQIAQPFPQPEELGPHYCEALQAIVVFPAPKVEANLYYRSRRGGDRDINLPPAHVYITSLTSTI